MPDPKRPLIPSRPLIVRLRNWVGDVTLGVPLLQRLHDDGFELQLVGRGWARELLAGHGWPVHVLPKRLGESVALLRRLKAAALAADAGFAQRLNALCLPYSFSSALQFRLAGLRALGHAYEGRSLLLARAAKRPRGGHELQVYWDLGNRLLGVPRAPPDRIGLRVAPRHAAAAAALLQAHGIEPGFIAICPFAGGTFEGRDKNWPAFADFVRDVLPGFGRRIVVCPGPGEEALARAQFAGATLLAGVDLGGYAALLQRAGAMVANDTGPGHMAAAVGTPLVSVLGPSDPAQWRPWGPGVQLVQDGSGWPAMRAVEQAVALALSARSPERAPPSCTAAGE